MKKLLAFLLATVMTVSLAACSGTASNSSPAAASNAPAASAESAAPEGYKPPNNVNLIVPYAAGGANDLLARLVAKHAAKYTDCDLVVTNIGGRQRHRRPCRGPQASR